MPSEDATSTIQPTTRKHKRPPLLVEDLERMTMLMAQQGVLVPADLFHQLLDAFEQLQHQHQAQPQQGLEVIRWFTTEIDSSYNLSSNRNAILSRQLSFQLMKLKVLRLKMPSSKTSCRLLNLVSIASINCWDTQQMRLLLLQLPSLLQSPPH